MRNKQQNMGSQQAVDSSNYLPRTVCMEIPRQVSWLMEVIKIPSQKQTLHLSSVAYVFIFSNYSYEDSSRVTRDSLQICTESNYYLAVRITLSKVSITTSIFLASKKIL